MAEIKYIVKSADGNVPVVMRVISDGDTVIDESQDTLQSAIAVEGSGFQTKYLNAVEKYILSISTGLKLNGASREEIISLANVLIGLGSGLTAFVNMLDVQASGPQAEPTQ